MTRKPTIFIYCAIALLLSVFRASTASSQETCTVESPCPPDSGECYAATDINCGPPGCVEMALACRDDSDCGSGQVCADTTLEIAQLTGSPGQCTPSPCSDDGDCPTDFDCTGEVCGRASCDSSSDCDGVCVNGSCHEEPGYCTYPHPAPPPEPTDRFIPIAPSDN